MVKDRLKAKIPAYVLSRCRKVGVIEVNHMPAPAADEVMMGLVHHDLVLGTAPAQIGLAENAEVAEPFQGPIDCRAIHIGKVLCRLLVNLFGAGMPSQLAEGVENCDPLSRHPQAVSARPIHDHLKNIH